MKKRITDIQLEGKHSSRRTLFLDGERFRDVEPSLITKFGLRIGLEIEEAVLQKLIAADEGMRAKNYAFDLLLSQSYSKQQMSDQLERKGFGYRAIDTALEGLEQLGYIKDEKYAKNWVNRRQRSKPRSKKMLQHELTSKGIDKTTVDRVLEEIGSEQETELALQLAQKQVSRYRSLPTHVAKRRLHGFLQRRGFDYETIQRTIEQVLRG
ncbi:MAG: regulatory protein RecX [Candidatus Poribacteria bacterium]|nr:regulatory protein RecX [Candidatus Poribacteria bacterium]